MESSKIEAVRQAALQAIDAAETRAPVRAGCPFCGQTTKAACEETCPAEQLMAAVKNLEQR
jgi:hypothetical protein